MPEPTLPDPADRHWAICSVEIKGGFQANTKKKRKFRITGSMLTAGAERPDKWRKLKGWTDEGWSPGPGQMMGNIEHGWALLLSKAK